MVKPVYPYFGTKNHPITFFEEKELFFFATIVAMSVKHAEFGSFTLENFEGPLAFLLHLVQKSEIDISEISLRAILSQYLERFQANAESDVNNGAEFISTTASLLWLKSKGLLPAHEAESSIQNPEDEESPFAILPKLIEYLSFKQVSKELLKRDQQQNAFFVRGVLPSTEPLKKGLGIDSSALQELTELFQQQLIKANARKKTIQEEVWRVADAMTSLRKRLKADSRIDARTLFAGSMVVEELIVFFLAVLELMKQGFLRVEKSSQSNQIWLCNKGQHE